MLMERALQAVKAGVAFALALHMHHRFHGPAVDYVGLGAAAAASWAGVPGPGEPVLIAESIFAAQHDLDIASVIAVAWLGASLGGLGGWFVGLKAGRAVITAPGPLHNVRTGAVRRGEEVFSRHPVLAILLTPSWVAGIHRPRTSVYVAVNEFGAALWAAGIGLAAYFVGPSVVEFVEDLGTVTVIGLAVLIAVSVGGEVVRRRRRAQSVPGPQAEHDR
jgi:membrane protein DedA with SNARE-associated domain